MPLALLGLLFQILAVCCFTLVLWHAFKRSVGTGFMVLLNPFQCIHYGFTQFEHRLKGMILAGWMGGFVVGVVLRSLALVRGA